MKTALAATALGLATIAMPALAQDQDPAKDPDQLICKIEKKVNSRFTTRTCHTRAEWDDFLRALSSRWGGHWLNEEVGTSGGAR